MLNHIGSGEILRSLYAFLIALGIALAATPVVRKLAIVSNAVDIPKDERRMHKKPMPLWGGMAIFAGFTVSVLIFVPLTVKLTGILIGAALMMALGAVDDRCNLSAWVKLLFQLAIAIIPVACGLRIEHLSNLIMVGDSPSVILDWLAAPVTVLWIVGVSNAVNLIDGLDGLACGISCIASLSIFLIVIQLGDAATALIIAALAGSCIGFLPYNFNPAKIFMGDTGALFLGYVLATVSVAGMFKWYTLVTFGLPFIVLGLPIFDIVFSALRRILHGQKPWVADRGHIHHRLIDMGMSQKQAVAVLYALSGILGLSAVLLAQSTTVKLIIMVAVIVITIAIAVRLFFAHERHLKELQEQAIAENRERAEQATRLYMKDISTNDRE